MNFSRKIRTQKKLRRGGTPPSKKFNYPVSFLKKDGKLKKNMKKQAAEFRKTHNRDGTPKYPNVETMPSLVNPEPEPEPEPEVEPVLESDYPDYDPERPSFNNLPDDLIEYFFTNIANLNEEELNEETCLNIRNMCELFPRTCYLNRDFLERYIRRCRMIAKTGLYRQQIVDTPEIDVIGDPRRREWRRDYHSMSPQSYLVQSGDWKTRWRNSRYEFPSTSYEIDRLLNQIPKTQMNPKAKGAFLRVFDFLFQPLQMRDNTGQLVDQRRSYNYMIRELKRDPDKLELFIQMWRHELEKEGLNFNTIEYTIRRFLKTFYE